MIGTIIRQKPYLITLGKDYKYQRLIPRQCFFDAITIFKDQAIMVGFEIRHS